MAIAETVKEIDQLVVTGSGYSGLGDRTIHKNEFVVYGSGISLRGGFVRSIHMIKTTSNYGGSHSFIHYKITIENKYGSFKGALTRVRNIWPTGEYRINVPN